MALGYKPASLLALRGGRLPLLRPGSLLNRQCWHTSYRDCCTGLGSNGASSRVLPLKQHRLLGPGLPLSPPPWGTTSNACSSVLGSSGASSHAVRSIWPQSNRLAPPRDRGY